MVGQVSESKVVEDAEKETAEYEEEEDEEEEGQTEVFDKHTVVRWAPRVQSCKNSS